MSKKFRISIDAGVTFYTFPGDTADLQSNATAIKDTVFGQDYESDQTGLIAWTMSCNGYYKGFAGYVADIFKGGTSTALSAEATTLVTTRVYQITNTAHRFIDPTVAVTIKDGATDHTADVLSIDYLNGIVTFKPTYTVTGAVTFATGNFIPLAQIAKAQTFTLTQTAASKDVTDFISAQSNNGTKSVDYALKTVSLDLGGIFSISNGWLAALQARNPVVIEINPDGTGASQARGIFKPMTASQSGKVGDLEAEAVKFNLSVPDPAGVASLLKYPFQWYHNASTLSQAIQNAQAAWEGATQPIFQYLYDGTNGQSGSGVITDISMTGGLDVMNAFAIKIAGSGQLSAVGTG